jgi:hypothetical protein
MPVCHQDPFVDRFEVAEQPESTLRRLRLEVPVMETTYPGQADHTGGRGGSSLDWTTLEKGENLNGLEVDRCLVPTGEGSVSNRVFPEVDSAVACTIGGERASSTSWRIR